MRLWFLLVALVTMPAQNGKFSPGYTATDNGVSIEFVTVHDGPGCRHNESCAWMVSWNTKRKCESVEIAVTFAGGADAPSIAVIVPGSKTAPLDKRKPVFEIPLGTVRGIDFILWNGDKEVARATFK